MFKYKISDQVLITGGKDKGQTGNIKKVLPLEDRVVVEGKNLYKKHIKKQGETKGRMEARERSLPTSNIAIICPNCKKPTRVGFLSDGGVKTRICRKCKKSLTVKKEVKK